MIEHSSQKDISVHVPQEAILIGNNEPTTATFNHNEIEFSEDNEKEIFPLITSPQGVMYDLKNTVLLHKDGRWYVNPTWLFDSINNIENNIKKNQSGSDHDPVYEKMREQGR